MSLFHKTDPNTGPLAFTGEEAIIAVLFLVVTVDGNIAPEEEDLVIAASNRIKTLRKLGIDGFNDAVQKVRMQSARRAGRKYSPSRCRACRQI